MPTNPGQIQSPFAVEIPQTAPEGFTDPQVAAAVNMFLVQQQQLLAGLLSYIKQVGQPNSPDDSQTPWKNITPDQSIIDWHLTRFYKKCDTALNYGNLVYTTATGVAKADQSLSVPAQAYVLANYKVGDIAECFDGDGIIVNISGTSQGVNLYLGNNGGLSTVAGTTMSQYVGYMATNTTARIRIAPMGPP